MCGGKNGYTFMGFCGYVALGVISTLRASGHMPSVGGERHRYVFV